MIKRMASKGFLCFNLKMLFCTFLFNLNIVKQICSYTQLKNISGTPEAIMTILMVSFDILEKAQNFVPWTYKVLYENICNLNNNNVYISHMACFLPGFSIHGANPETYCSSLHVGYHRLLSCIKIAKWRIAVQHQHSSVSSSDDSGRLSSSEFLRELHL